MVKRSMRIASITLAAALLMSLADAALAQGSPGENVTGGSTTGSSASEPGNMHANANPGRTRRRRLAERRLARIL